MRCTLAGTAGTCLLASVALTAADFWQEKDFTVWSAQQVEKMLTDSPWARKVTIVVGSLREGALDGFQGGGAGLGGGGEAPRSPDGDNAEFQQVRRVTVTVAWTSALPIRQALVRRQIGPDAPISPDRQRHLSEDEPFYTVAVAGLPQRMTARVGTIDEVKAKTALKPARKESIAPDDIRVSRDGDQSVRMEFLFPKRNTIGLDDKEVEFSTTLGDVDVKKKFRLADMMIRGRLLL
jgi:hypothetical protein